MACVALLLTTGTAWAGPEDLANDISSEVMSPFCPGVTLHDCPSERASAYRAKIVGWAEAGWNEQRILARVQADFGPIVNATPPSDGAGFLAWILPGAAALLGGALAALAVRRWTARRANPPGRGRAVTAMAPDERRRLESELKALRRGS